MKRSAELDAEIRASLAQLPKKPSLKTRAQLDAEIDAILAGGSKANRHEIATALGFRYPKKAPSVPKKVTDTNVYALCEAVIEYGPKLPRRIAAVHAPHIKRCIVFNLVDPDTLTLTAHGREQVGDELIKRIDRETSWNPRENTFVPPESRAMFLERDRAAHRAKIAKLEQTLASLSR